MWTRNTTTGMRGSRGRAGTFTLPSFNLLILFPTWILSFGSKTLMAQVSKDPLEMGISGKQAMKIKINKLQQNQVLSSRQHPANSVPLALSCGLCDSPIFLYMTSFKCCSSFALAGISLMSTAMKSSEKNISGDCSLSHSTTFP